MNEKEFNRAILEKPYEVAEHIFNDESYKQQGKYNRQPVFKHLYDVLSKRYVNYKAV